VSLTSSTWARDYNETRQLGDRDSQTRPAEWTRLAKFYSYWQHWPLVEQVAAAPGRTVEQNARLYAMVAMVMADADQAMVDGKLTYSFWRPITAIRNGDQDGNAATDRQADWEPLLKTPMHPEYPCGHCVVISARRVACDHTVHLISCKRILFPGTASLRAYNRHWSFGPAQSHTSLFRRHAAPFVAILTSLSLNTLLLILSGSYDRFRIYSQ
jgi:hypothetical protein